MNRYFLVAYIEAHGIAIEAIGHKGWRSMSQQLGRDPDFPEFEVRPEPEAMLACIARGLGRYAAPPLSIIVSVDSCMRARAWRASEIRC